VRDHQAEIVGVLQLEAQRALILELGGRGLSAPRPDAGARTDKAKLLKIMDLRWKPIRSVGASDSTASSTCRNRIYYRRSVPNRTAPQQALNGKT
jgi:hypothetical protein